MRIKNSILFVILILFVSTFSAQAQSKIIIPDFAQINNTAKYSAFNRDVEYREGAVYIDEKENAGFLKLNGIDFSTGRIELDIKGKDVMQKSFVGIAFHGVNDSTYDAVYFRPFNFKKPDRMAHSVQYISEPEYGWYVLRENHPGEYEKPVSPVPEPDDWFHATIIIHPAEIQVFVNNSATPSLVVKSLNGRKQGWLGLWVGNGSDGSFRNLKIYPE